MFDAQKSKSKKCFQNLTVIAKDRTINQVSVEHQRRDAVTNFCLVRLIELKKFPVAQVYWTAAEAKLNRRLLGARKSVNAPNSSGGSLLMMLTHMVNLTLFNDYDGFNPQNGLIK